MIVYLFVRGGGSIPRLAEQSNPLLNQCNSLLLPLPLVVQCLHFLLQLLHLLLQRSDFLRQLLHQRILGVVEFIIITTVSLTLLLLRTASAVPLRFEL